MSVVAKFRVNSIENRAPLVERNGKHVPIRSTKRSDGSVIEEGAGVIKLDAVYAEAGDPEASAEDIGFSLATPYGQISMNVTNPDALEEFQVGDTFYVRFERA